MNKTRVMRLAAGAAGLTVVLTAVAPSNAHVTANPRTVAPDSTVVVDFRVPHGCDGSSTRGLHLTIPEGITSVKPKVKAGWAIETTVADGQVRTITWTGGLVKDSEFDDFTVRFRTPNEPGRVLEIPALQQCLVGETNWNNTGGQEPHPAPRLTLDSMAAAAGDSSPLMMVLE